MKYALLLLFYPTFRTWKPCLCLLRLAIVNPAWFSEKNGVMLSTKSMYYTLTREFVCLTFQDVITGILYTNCPLLNYLILIAKLYLWGCRRNQTLPVITAFSSKVKIKYETEKYICAKTNKMDKFNKKWALPLDSVT